MFKFLVLPSLLLWTGLFPVTAWSDMGKRLKEAQTYFPEDISLLSALVDEVLTNNPGIQAIQAEVDASAAKKDSAGQALYNPELELDYENSDIHTSSLGIIQTIDWSDKRSARRQVAQFEQIRSMAKLKMARQTLAAELLQGLSGYHTARDKDALIKLRIELLQEFVQLAKKRYQSGDLNQAELSLAQLAYAEASMQRTRVSSELMETQQLLITITGGGSSNWPGIPTALPKIDFQTEQIDEFVAQLPVFQQQLARVETAMARVKLRRREQNADPTIGIRAGREDSDNLIGVTLSIPLNVRNNFRAEVNIANAQLTQTEYESQAIARQVQSKLVSTSSRYKLVRETWENWQETGQSNMANQFSLIHKQWQASEISTTDYFMQLNQTLDTRLSAIELRDEFWNAWIDWLQASAQITTWLKLNN